MRPRPIPFPARPVLVLAFAFVLVAALVLAPAARALCGNPASPWSTSLFCQVPPGDFPFSIPQVAPPSAPPAPTTPAQLRDFWLHFLPLYFNAKGDGVRCLDGTAPAFWIDKANDGTGDIESDDWLVVFTGGGSCSAVDPDDCYDEYTGGEHGEMSSAGIGTLTRSYGGILDPVPGNDFREYNRIRVHKCSYDRYNGFDVDTVTTTGGVTYDQYQVGFSIANAILLELRHGLTYTEYEDDGFGGVVAVSKTLPPLKDADTVLFYGHSGGAHGLMHNVDRFATRLGLLTRTDGNPFSADVRAIFDSNSTPALEFEAQARSTGTLWDEITTQAGPPFDTSDDLYLTGGGIADQYDAWDAALDTSCEAAHGAFDPQCLDRFHVLFHHVTTPFFVRQDLEDPNGGHLGGGSLCASGEHQVLWSDPLGACMVTTDYQDRVTGQLGEVVNRDTDGELATGCSAPDCDADAGSFPTVYAISLRCREHEGFMDSDRVRDELDDGVTTWTVHDMLVEFMGQAASGVATERRDGVGYTSNCFP